MVMRVVMVEVVLWWCWRCSCVVVRVIAVEVICVVIEIALCGG